MSLTPHGVGGLKLLAVALHVVCRGLTPHGVGGLKYQWPDLYKCQHQCLTPHGVGGLKSCR